MMGEEGRDKESNDVCGDDGAVSDEANDIRGEDGAIDDGGCMAGEKFDRS